MAFAQSYIRGNQKVSGFYAWYMKAYGAASGTADGAYHSIGGPVATTKSGGIQEGTLVTTSLFTPDSYKRGIVFAYEFKATAKALFTNKTNLIKTLDVLASSDIDHVLLGINGTIYSTENLSATPGGKFGGMDWEFICDGGAAKHRYVLLTSTRVILASELATMMTSTFPTANPAIGTDPGTDLLHAWDALVQADLNSAAIAKIEVAAPFGGSLQNLGLIKNSKFSAKTVAGTVDEYGREKPAAIVITASAECHQASSTELAQMPTTHATMADVKFTFADGMTFTTSAQQLGVQTDYHLDKDMEDSSHILFKFDGNIVNTQGGVWDGLVA